MTSKWKEKKKAKKLQAQTIQRDESEKERIRRYNRAYRRAHLAETAARQRRWRANRRIQNSMG